MRWIRIAIVVMLLVACRVALHGQGLAEVVHETPLHVRHFAGTIVDSKGMTVEYATVELHDVRNHRLLASTFADSKGNFYFDDKKYGKRVEIRVSQKGFNPTQYTVMLKPFGDMRMRLVLSAAH